MVEPTSELMMRILQDVQETTRAIQETLRDHSRRFDRIDKRIEELHESMLGLAGHANVRRAAGRRSRDKAAAGKGGDHV